MDQLSQVSGGQRSVETKGPGGCSALPSGCAVRHHLESFGVYARVACATMAGIAAAHVPAGLSTVAGGQRRLLPYCLPCRLPHPLLPPARLQSLRIPPALRSHLFKGWSKGPPPIRPDRRQCPAARNVCCSLWFAPTCGSKQYFLPGL